MITSLVLVIFSVALPAVLISIPILYRLWTNNMRDDWIIVKSTAGRGSVSEREKRIVKENTGYDIDAHWDFDEMVRSHQHYAMHCLDPDYVPLYGGKYEHPKYRQQ